MDGGGICAHAQLHEGKYRERGGPGWARKFSGRAQPRERGVVPDGTYRGVGAFFVRAGVGWISATLHGATAGQQAARRDGEPISRALTEQAEFQECVCS